MKHTLPILLLASLLPLGAVLGDEPHAGIRCQTPSFHRTPLCRLTSTIGLSQDQIGAIQTQMGKAQSRVDALRKQLEHETETLAALAKPDHVDEAALVAQLDKVLDAERELKHLHLRLLAEIKNILTPGQQTKLRELMKAGGVKLADETRQRLTGKLAQVKAGVEKWQAAGRDPSAFAQAMQNEFKPISSDAGKVTGSGGGSRPLA